MARRYSEVKPIIFLGLKPLATILFLLSCGGSAPSLPEGYITETTKIFTVDIAGGEEGVRFLNVLTPSPAAEANGNNGLSEGFALMGLNAAVITADSGCDFTVSGVFPVASADADSYDSYDFTGIDGLIAPLTKYGIPAMFQAKFGLGKTSCVEKNGAVAGSPPEDPSKWADEEDETLGFIAEMALAKSIPFDTLVYSSRGATPFEHLEIAKRLQEDLSE